MSYLVENTNKLDIKYPKYDNKDIKMSLLYDRSLYVQAEIK